ncbi:MAG: ATP-binding protein, partial [Geminicoccaceae bacterium]
GLGLHIAKGIASLHDANLSLRSEPGSGTTATLHLPKSRLVEH